MTHIISARLSNLQSLSSRVRFPQVICVALAVFLTSVLAPATVEAASKIPVNVESTPPGATVYVDSVETTPIGTTPMSRVRIERGSHTLIFRKKGFEDTTLQVNIRRYRETFRVVLKALATISVTGGNADANGAEVRVDGQVIGQIPAEGLVKPGRHLIQIVKEGFETYSQWVDLKGGQVFTLPAVLQKSAPESGSVLISADISGAQILIDGTPRGTTPTVIEGLAPGKHTVELRANEPNLKPVIKEIFITAGQRAVLNASFKGSFTGGTLRVMCNVPACQISIDGEVIGPSPAEKNVSPGEHIVEASAAGHQKTQQTVSVEAGKTKVISLDMTGAPGKIVVQTSAQGAIVIVDGEEKGAPPVVINDAPAGAHAIVIRASGYQEFRTTCQVGPGPCEVNAELEPVTTPVRVVANARGAMFIVDGKEMGAVPWEGKVQIGEHRFEVSAPDMRTHSEQVDLKQQASTRLFDVTLIGKDELTPEELAAKDKENERIAGRAMARAGHPLPDGLAVLDFSIGWPYILEGRLGIGILDWFEAGFAVRTFVRLTEFEGRFKLGFKPIDQLSVGAQVRFGGGLGPTSGAANQFPENCVNDCIHGAEREDVSHDANNGFFILEALGTIHFGRAGSVTLWAAMDVYSDRWDWHGSDGGRLHNPGDLGRQTTVRARLGGSVEIIMNREWNIWGSFEGAFGDKRRVLGNILGAGNVDSSIYGRLGLTYKFGL